MCGPLHVLSQSVWLAENKSCPPDLKLGTGEWTERCMSAVFHLPMKSVKFKLIRQRTRSDPFASDTYALTISEMNTDPQ